MASLESLRVLPALLRGLGSHLDYWVTSYVFPQVHHPCLCQGLSYNPRAEPLLPWFGICDGPRHPRLAFKTFGNTARAAPPRLSLRHVPWPVFLLCLRCPSKLLYLHLQLLASSRMPCVPFSEAALLVTHSPVVGPYFLHHFLWVCPVLTPHCCELQIKFGVREMR